MADNIPFRGIPDLMNRLLDEAAARRRERTPNYAGPLTPIQGPKREQPAPAAPRLQSAA